MKKLFEGVIEFQKEVYENNKNLFEDLRTCQQPHTLFIGCSDSRVVPNLILNSEPGELFMIRNIANLVPRYRESQEFLATTSAIEYAVEVLQVKHILVCGHSNCGGINALLAPHETLERVPHVSRWLEISAPVRDKVLQPTYDELNMYQKEWMAERLNIVLQLEHLLTYPYIKQRLEQKRLKLLGWYYIIETGEIYNYNRETKQFELIEEAKL